MEKYYQQTVGASVITSSGQTLTRIKKILIDPDNGKVVGFLVRAQNKVIAPIDVLKWDNTINIHDAEDIVEIEDIIKVEKVIKSKIGILKNKVITKNGEKVGIVVDFGVNTKFFELSCLVIAKTFLGLFHWNKRLIPAKDIVEIRKDKIIIKSIIKPIQMKKLRVGMVSS